ncbi:hypothetical protein BDD43_5946 [Mucilaginibacter gracilis]|uniref:Uncharacterized protein n=1 Tax=Mucilaginibacter gracilis TaxID=423350 RepID=A0A495J9R7_9SPHI|nr:hypothetical protein [Mucilaginibacter gracilis]RKR85675.1 hypothetical protein BDD43_5946 [Mucilaginibacter gracilis]
MFIKRKKIENELSLINQKLNALAIENNSHKILPANILARLNKANEQQIIQNIQLAEFKVYSQWGDDGIIQFLVDYLDISQKTFIEFGVQNYTEANTRFLLINNNWTGLIMDGSEENINYVKKDDIYWQFELTAIPVFITTENINSLITQNGFSGEVGILHIDIDGNDYWVWKEIDTINPVIVIVEYNSIYGPDNTWTTPYQADFYRTAAHHSNLYFGASLAALCDLAEEKGYHFIGSNSHGNNGYFVRKDKIKDLRTMNAQEGYVLSKFRESRDENGDLTYISGTDRLKAISGMDIYNTRTNELEKIK